MKKDKVEILQFFTQNIELTASAFATDDHRSSQSRKLIDELRNKFSYSPKTADLDIYRVARKHFYSK